MTQLELDFGEPPAPTFTWNTQDYSKFLITSNSNLGIGYIKPNYNMQFSKDGKTVGTIDWNGPEMIFTGDLAPSARVFFDYLTGCFLGRLKQEYDNGFKDGQIKTSL